MFCKMASVVRIFSRRLLPVKYINISRALLCTSSRRLANADTVTHTGQVFDKDDYKRVRFTNREKTVNEQFAIDLIDDVPPIEVGTHIVWCDGGDAALGHPKVYINLDQEGPHACGYCGLRYVMKGKPH